MTLDSRTRKAYNARFSKKNRKNFRGDHISPEVAMKFDKRFNGLAISILFRSITPEEANRYDQRFGQWDISALIKAKCPPEVANQYNKRFGIMELEKLCESGVSPIQANSYPEEYCGYGISDLFKAGVPLNLINKYNKRFESSDIALLFKAGVFPDQAEEYDKRLKGADIAEFFQAGISPKQAIKNYARFNKKAKSIFEDYQIPLAVANAYNSRFKIEDITRFALQKIPPQIANKYNKRFSGQEVSRLNRVGCNPDTADDYDIRFDGYEIAKLSRNSVSCPASVANRYNKTIDGFAIALFYRLGITPEIINCRRGSKMYRALLRISNSKDVQYNLHLYSFITTGTSSIILLRGPKQIESLYSNQMLREHPIAKKSLIERAKQRRTAWKFSSNPIHEYQLLKRLKKQQRSSTNVVKLRHSIRKDSVFELKYIEGISLGNWIDKYHDKFNDQSLAGKIIKYASGVSNGLIELRRAGIWYHRDIRPANIMIDEYNDKAIIIDLGIATTDRHALPKYNKRFGGPNDLVSLGQVMYYMATGKHLFAKSESMTRTFSDIKDEINDYRTKVYADKTGKLLQKHLEQIDNDIQNEKVRELTKECLTSRRGQYQKMQRMFERYANE